MPRTSQCWRPPGGGHLKQTETIKMETLLRICPAKQIIGMRLGTPEDQHESTAKGEPQQWDRMRMQQRCLQLLLPTPIPNWKWCLSFFETVSRRQHWTRTPLFNAHRSQNKREAQDNTKLNDDAQAQRRPRPRQTDRDGQSRTETNKKRHPNGETQEDHMGNTQGHTREDHSKPYL